MNVPVLTGMAVVVLCAATVMADECLRDCGDDSACEIAVANCLIEAGRAREAVDRLKPLVARHPEEAAFSRLLARAYLADNNHFWAERTLQDALARNPDDCMSRSWLAWVHVAIGDFDLAREVLQQSGCPRSEAETARWLLLQAFMVHTEDDADAASESVAQVPEAGILFPEDERLWLFLRRSRQPGWIEPISTRLELSGGYTSNASAGSPSDPGTSGPESALGRVDLFSRFVMPSSPRLRPVLDADLKGHGITAEAARDESYLAMSARPGMIIGETFPRLLAGYKADILLLNEEEKTEFHEGHRGELELETGAMTYFAGGGHRTFAESGRTRWEVDGGVGGALNLPHDVRSLLALSLRYYDAVGEAYDLVGGTGVAVAHVGLGRGSHLRLGTSIGLDYYPSSGGERGQLAHGTDDKRFDVLTKWSAELWSPLWHGLRLALGYEFSWRDSTADESTENYDYNEHRVLLKTRWAFDLDPWAPDIVTPDNHVALDYGLGSQGDASLEGERIQDLLRQDESSRRSSSCAN